MRELVTVQVGSFANFIGSHFWNFQDELIGLESDPLSESVFRHQYLNRDVLYRSGETQQGISTYTPRLLSIDLSGSLGPMSTKGTLQDDSSGPTLPFKTWSGSVAMSESEACKKNLFLQRLEDEEGENGRTEGKRSISDREAVDSLEREVEFWTDFSKAHYHSRSLYELCGVWMEEPCEFRSYGMGKDAYVSGSHAEDIADRLRYFVEECDRMQGFQFIVDDSGGFTGIASEFLESVVDTYTNAPVLLYSSRPPFSSSSKSLQLQDAVFFSRASQFCSLFVPVGLSSLSNSKAARHMCLKEERQYHSSAVYASALHGTTLPFLMERPSPTAGPGLVTGAMSIGDMVRVLSPSRPGRSRVSLLDAALPAPSLSAEPLLQALHPLTQEAGDDAHAAECITVLGILNSRGERATVSQVVDVVRVCGPSLLAVSVSPLPLPLSFPSIFCGSVSRHDHSRDCPAPLEATSVPLATRLRSGTAVLPFLHNRLKALRTCHPHSDLLRAWGFGPEDVDDMVESLSDSVTSLQPPHSGSDSE